MRVHFVSFGCKVNQYETEGMKSLFVQNGFKISANEKEAEIYVINSCTVTAQSDHKLKQTIHHLKKENPASIVVLTGCFPQAFREKAEAMEEVDVITGTKEREKIIELVNSLVSENKRQVNIKQFEKGDRFEELICEEFTEKTRAFVKIQDGCNQFCSYCIIPYSRGRIRSKPLEVLKKEVSILAMNGHKEIVLVGINLAFYGNDLDNGMRLVDAVEACCEIYGVERVRLGSLEPEMISDNDLIRLANQPKFCPQFHLSLQSGCDLTLKNMNRKYNTVEYSELVDKIRKYFDNPAITTDIMVGFPKETEEDFKASLDFAEKIGFSKIHIFPYSRRSGTVADLMPEQIPKATKTERVKRMQKSAKILEENFLKSQVGRVVPVLFEKETSTEYHQGYSPNYTLIKIPLKSDNKSLRREIFYVKIKSIGEECCYGEITD